MNRKRNIPGLERLRAEEKKRKEAASKPWYKRKIVVIIAGVILPAAGTALVNGKSIMENLQGLPAATANTYDRFLSWYYDDPAWNGVWSAAAEGYVDSGDYPPVTDTDLRIELATEQGKVGGIISTGRICSEVPVFHFLLVEGRITPGHLEAVAFDYVGGTRKNFAVFKAKQDGQDMVVDAIEDPLKLLPAHARIRLHPDSGRPKKQEDFNYCPKGKPSLSDFAAKYREQVSGKKKP